MKVKCIQPLFDGPLDIIGDIHGEIGALHQLLSRLGYQGSGKHPEGRRLVFVGDLLDRGPDSLAVARLVADFISAGHAQCVLGNHELNLLRPSKKGLAGPDLRHGNHWFHGLPEKLLKNSDAFSFQRLASPAEQTWLIHFLNTLPIALERENLRVVHACWHEPSIQKIRLSRHPISTLFLDFEKQIKASHSASMSTIEKELREQNENPVKVITSGLEEYATNPYYASGKLRHLTRAKWWLDYHGPLVIFGHYWRKRLPITPAHKEKIYPPDKSSIPNIFENYHPFQMLGSSAMCIDYSVGGRYFERHKGVAHGTAGFYLSAIRIDPESTTHTLLFDDGYEHQIKL